MTTPESSDLSDAQAEITRLITENDHLRTELKRRKAMPRTRSVEALKFGGSFLLPMLDRQKVFRTFVSFFDEASAYTLEKQHWPPRERVVERGRDFGLALLRFFVKRRLVFVLFSLLAFIMPLVQVWLVFKQNAIIENQNKYFNIQVYDIVAQSLTGSDTTAKQITSALLAREDFSLINGIIASVFESDSVGSFTEEDAAGGRPLFLEETAARGHLVSAMGQAIESHSGSGSHEELWAKVEATYGLVANDATARVPQLLRMPRQAAFKKPTVGQECFRYLFSLTSFLRRSYTLSRTVGKEQVFFRGIAPMIDRLSKLRLSGNDEVFHPVFVSAFHELFFEIAQKPKFGQPVPEVDAREVDRLLKEGFRIVVERTKAAGFSVEEKQLKQLMEVP